MRRIVMLCLCLMFFIGSMFTSFSERGMEILTLNSEKFMDERNDVKLAVEAARKGYESYLGDSVEDIDFDLMYRCHSFDDSNFVEAYRENGNFAENINENYFWVVPSYENGGEVDVVSNSDSEFGWSVRGARSFEKYDETAKLELETVYDSILSKFPSADSDSFHNLYSEYINCKLIYFINNGQEYLYPIFLLETDPEWADSGEVYTAEDFVERAASEFESGIKDGGVVSFLQEHIDFFVIGSIVLLIVAISICTVVKKRKNSREGEEE